MATVESIVDALSAQFLTLSDVDFVSTDSFMPAIETQSIAALTLAFSLETQSKMIGMANNVLHVHRIRTEFWVKHEQGKETSTMSLARDIGRKAINQLIVSNGTGYQLHKPSQFEFQIDQGMLQDTALPWLVCVLVTSVQDTECAE